MSKRNLSQIFAIILSAVCVGACARTVVSPETEMLNFGLPRPQQILVYDFAVTEAEATDHGPAKITANETNGTPQGEHEIEIGRQVAKALAEELVRGLRDLGFAAERKPRGTPIARRQLLIDGEFLDVDEGNRLERLVIGFGMGASRVDTEAHVYYGARRRKLLDFKTHADSGKMPGAAATVGAGVIVGGGVTAGMAATSVGAGTVKEYHSAVERMASHSADQAAAYLSEFFAKQGWIRPDQIKSPTLGK
jgi:hypothetical protein